MTKERRGRYYWTRKNGRSVWFVLVFSGVFANALVMHFGMPPLPVFVVFAALIVGWGLWDYRATITR